jgi:tetratricopeptide (TPR) repeat protein
MRILIVLLLFSSQQAADAYRQGVALLEKSNLAEALPLLEKATQLEPYNAQYWKALGVAYASANQLRDAEQPLRKACTLNPALLDACYYYGRNLYANDRYQDALAPLESAFKTDRVKGRAEAAIAQCHEALGLAAEAEKRFQAALKRHDAFENDTRLAYGHFLIRQARAAEAIPMLQATQQPEGLYLLGLALSQADRFEDAAAKLERAVGLKPDHVAARVLLAKVYRRLGRASDAARLEAANSTAQ